MVRTRDFLNLQWPGRQATLPFISCSLTVARTLHRCAALNTYTYIAADLLLLLPWDTKASANALWRYCPTVHPPLNDGVNVNERNSSRQRRRPPPWSFSVIVHCPTRDTSPVSPGMSMTPPFQRPNFNDHEHRPSHAARPAYHPTRQAKCHAPHELHNATILLVLE